MNDRPNPPEPSPRPTVLVVEDDLPVLQMATHILGATDAIVLAARSGEEALATYEEQGRVDLLFSDVVLPGISGLELATALLQRQPGLRVLITTGQRTPEVHARIQASGHPFLAKPYTAHGLRDAVLATLELGDGTERSA